MSEADPVLVVDYDPLWPERFVIEAERVRQALGPERVVAIEHAGSTSIPGLAAKPIIDLLVAVPSLENALSAVPEMAALGYAFWYDNPDKSRLYFVKGLPPNGPRTAHVHIFQAGSKEWERPLLFRDYLRAHPEERDRYAELKRELAERFRHDRDAYTDSKAEYIASIVEKTRQEKVR